jgi:predicted  nucleic acid-binding Zn-ribbon protein
MHNVAVFFQLKEYDSLCRENDSLKKQKSDLIDRLKKRQSELHNAQEQAQTLKLRLRNLDRELAEFDRVLSQRLAETSKQ